MSRSARCTHTAATFSLLDGKTIQVYLNSLAGLKAVELRSELSRLRLAAGPARAYPYNLVYEQVYDAYMRTATSEGHSPDALPIYSENEAERFWARTVPGPDGHIFWTGGQVFKRNADSTPRQLLPARWVWIETHGPIPMTNSVTPTCGETNCVNLTHLKCERRDGLVAFVPDERMLGRIQVVAMELGRTPSSAEWDVRGERPGYQQYAKRFGTWERACKAAGLKPFDSTARATTTPDQCITAIKGCAAKLGRRPLASEYDNYAAEVKTVSRTTINRRLAPTWPKALKKAGL